MGCVTSRASRSSSACRLGVELGGWIQHSDSVGGRRKSARRMKCGGLASQSPDGAEASAILARGVAFLVAVVGNLHLPFGFTKTNIY